ncbi:DUF1249 domain-containing protein [Haliea atlantica]|nr:histidine kinase [Haliea sp.]MAL95083.1 histidine kinase [Haliea sp.]
MVVSRAARRPHTIDLVRLHALCEANYARLLRLFPDYQQCNQREFEVSGARVRLEVLERNRYTTFFRLLQSHGEARWLGSLDVELRAYHDARMLEVNRFQSRRSVRGRYPYPNAEMFQEDEKLQQNLFLAEWLEHCLANGRTPATGVGFSLA